MDFAERRGHEMDAMPIPGAEVYYDEHFLSPEERLSSLTCCCASALGNDAGLPLGHSVPSGRSLLWRSRNALHIFSARVQTAFLDTRIALVESPRRRGHPCGPLCQFGLAQVGLQRRPMQSADRD